MENHPSFMGFQICAYNLTDLFSDTKPKARQSMHARVTLAILLVALCARFLP